MSVFSTVWERDHSALLPLTGVGDTCYCGSEEPTASPGVCNDSCLLELTQCGGLQGMTVYMIISQSSTTPILGLPETATTSSTVASAASHPAPTSTGSPDCGLSGYDGTVNKDYLILCDTALLGFDLTTVDSSSLASCIQQCNSWPPRNGELCVAVEYQEVILTCWCWPTANSSRLRPACSAD